MNARRNPTGELMNSRHKNPGKDHLPKPPPQLETEDRGVGLTDDQRVSRETAKAQQGPRVLPGPADLERQKKP
ncbi:hypothetical protein [Pseudomonas sp. NFIX28]|uniref:hypothetical protein n=1 Tax=Pseudomonas sp. NFIX28 TaxID=1566235 RepID=UPI0011140FB0|nr:hypothetical protein [Pseudomonas sp. NFIX28]